MPKRRNFFSNKAAIKGITALKLKRFPNFLELAQKVYIFLLRKEILFSFDLSPLQV
jgi:hypothetical protein